LKVEGGGFLANPRELGVPTMETQGKETAMQDRRGKRVSSKGAPKVVARQDEIGLRACFSEGSQHLLPLLELLTDAKASVDELMMGAARQFIEQLLIRASCKSENPILPHGHIRPLGATFRHERNYFDRLTNALAYLS
jgi:hypothetical protein